MRNFCVPNTSVDAILAPNLVMNTNLVSKPINCVSVYTYGVQVVFTGTISAVGGAGAAGLILKYNGTTGVWL